MLNGQETVAFGDAQYKGIEKRPSVKARVIWHVACDMWPCNWASAVLWKKNEADGLIKQAQQLKVGIRTNLDHPFRVVKRKFGFVKVRYRGLKKTTAQLCTLFALLDLWMVRGKSMGAQEWVRLKTRPKP